MQKIHICEQRIDAKGPHAGPHSFRNPLVLLKLKLLLVICTDKLGICQLCVVPWDKPLTIGVTLAHVLDLTRIHSCHVMHDVHVLSSPRSSCFPLSHVGSCRTKLPNKFFL